MVRSARRFASAIAGCLFVVSTATDSVASAAEPSGIRVTATQTDRGARIEVDGALFTEYLTESGSKPVLWPLIGPSGRAMTRAYPISPDDVPDEKRDHIHQRSVWFTHGDVAGVDFWAEGEGRGRVVHREFVAIASKDRSAEIVTHNDWVGPQGKICEDTRQLRFAAEPDCRWIDFDITLQADRQDVTFGDTKEGTFGIRVAESMKVDKGHGRIVNSQGEIDQQAWGKAASWVDYHGLVDGEQLGVAILNHPSSFRYPTYWHVRTYGLFAANPFGLHDFLARSEPIGAYTLPAGHQITLRYRIILHLGDESTSRIAERFAQYAQSP